MLKTYTPGQLLSMAALGPGCNCRLVAEYLRQGPAATHSGEKLEAAKLLAAYRPDYLFRAMIMRFLTRLDLLSQERDRRYRSHHRRRVLGASPRSRKSLRTSKARKPGSPE